MNAFNIAKPAKMVRPMNQPKPAGMPKMSEMGARERVLQKNPGMTGDALQKRVAAKQVKMQTRRQARKSVMPAPSNALGMGRMF